jgi:hypothetical protein
VDVTPALVAGAQPLEGVPPGEATLDDSAVLAQARAVRDAAGAELAAVDVVVVAAAGEQLPRAPARPAAQAADRRDGGTALSSGMSWVMSLRLPPVSVTASGMPPASQIRWCLEPGRARSTGEGPTWSPL